LKHRVLVSVVKFQVLNHTRLLYLLLLLQLFNQSFSRETPGYAGSTKKENLWVLSMLDVFKLFLSSDQVTGRVSRRC